jgi:hypothetical protein
LPAERVGWIEGTMKKLGLMMTGAALVAFTGSASAADKAPIYVPPVPAPSPVSGEIGVYLGATHWAWPGYGSPTSGTVFVLGGEGRVNIWTNPTWSFQLDASGEGTTAIDLTGSGNPDGRIQGVFGAHASTRNQSYLLGAFAGISTNDNLDNQGQMTHGIVGLEGQHYWSMATLYYQAGYFGRLSGSNVNEPLHLWFGRVALRYFLSVDTMLAGEFDYASGPTQGNGYTARIYAWRAEIEHMMPGSPWSVFARYDGNHAYSTYDSTEGTDEHQVVVGVKAMFGQPNLLARDRKGATLDMPTAIVRALPYSWVWYY